MAKTATKKAVNVYLDSLSRRELERSLAIKTRTIYRLATLKNKARKNPPTTGICYEIRDLDLVCALSPSWKLFSGNEAYPIPGNKKDNDPESAYYYDYPSKSRWIGQQKRYRFSLIDHLLKYAPIYYKAVEERLK